MESFPLISTSENAEPLTPSTLKEKYPQGSMRETEEITIPFLLGLRTIRRPVGDWIPVKRVPKERVSVEKDMLAPGERSNPSSIQAEGIKPSMARSVKINS